ncbi:hypothetical protein Syun_001234 [Stephania yunnanensis]|uniref:Gag-pol polyprotein n=1 Tax=Stephania yunnanensis TaxID=152371 RepID=A0AAP0LHF0_9MAGN
MVLELDRPTMAEGSSSEGDSGSLSTFADVTAIAKYLNFNLPTKLDEGNYIYWKVQVKAAIRALGLEFFIENKRASVTTDSSIIDEVLSRCDNLLMVWLFSNISKDVIGHVTECESSFEIWKTLESLFAQSSMARVLQLKKKMNNIKKGSSSISEFVLKVKTIAAELRSINQVITESDMIQSILSGLGHEFDPVVVLVASQKANMSLQDAQYMLIMHERRIEDLNQGSQTDMNNFSANFVDSSDKKSQGMKCRSIHFQNRSNNGFRGGF